MKYALWTIGGLAAIFALSFIGNAMGLFNIQFWGVKQANAQRNVFEQSQSYVEGKRQEVTKYRLEYMQTKDPQSREAIRQTILMSTANMDLSKLTPEQRDFVESLH